ncbi:MAG TPA: hypothetical protein VK738_17115 [Terriglobales bacterium]|jgi:hypothetical protein|nr:hypothetical protein [Terriglobales bacterium]
MTRNTKYQTAILMLMILLGLAACNFSKNSDSGYEYQFKTEQLNDKQGPADYDACALVTKVDAEAVLGEPLDRGKGDTTTPLGAKACAYVATASTSMAMVYIYLGPLSMGAESNMWEAQKKLWQDKGTNLTTVTGLGKDAYVDPNGHLHVLTPKVIMDLSVSGLKGATANTDAEKVLAQKAVSRM